MAVTIDGSGGLSGLPAIDSDVLTASGALLCRHDYRRTLFLHRHSSHQPNNLWWLNTRCGYFVCRKFWYRVDYFDGLELLEDWPFC